MNSIFVILFLILFSSMGFSKTLIVSDIDDTIKVSHVRDSIDLGLNAFVTTGAFKGMSEVYHSMVAQPETEIIYVTNAYDYLMSDSHNEFLRKNNFPKGKIFFRKWGSEDHKFKTIKNYIDKNKIDEVILIGDNGEEDISHYNRIFQHYETKVRFDHVSKEFKKRLSVVTYIRILYSKPDEVLPLEENQMGFVSPLELLIDLTSLGYITTDRFSNLAEKLALDISISEKVDTKAPQYFPDWINCKGFTYDAPSEILNKNIVRAFIKISQICQ